jgi:predicted dehydrogenase
MKKKQTRRNFLGKLTLGAIAAPYIVPGHVLGRTNIPAPSDRVVLGHIGVGGQGSALLNNFLQIDYAQSVAVSDCFSSRRTERKKQIDQHYADKFGQGTYEGCTAYTDFRDLLARSDIDAVVIATPDHWHVLAALYACKAGKDVYVEKPLGVSINQNKKLRESVKRYGRIFQYGTQQRSDRNFRFACELARNERIGTLKHIDVWCPGIYAQDQFHQQPAGSIKQIPVPDGFDYDMWLGPAPVSPFTADRCTCWGTYYHYDNSLGFIAGWGAHPLDIAQWGNNSDDTVPVSYEGRGTVIAGGLYNVVDSWDFNCRYASGVTMRFVSDLIAQADVMKYRSVWSSHGTTFIGSEGWVSVDRGGIYASSPTLLKSDLSPNDIHLYDSDNHYGNFVDCVKSRQQPVSTIGAAVQSDIISHLCDMAIRLNCSIEWDVEKETVVGNPTAERMFSRPLRSPWRLV